MECQGSGNMLSVMPSQMSGTYKVEVRKYKNMKNFAQDLLSDQHKGQMVGGYLIFNKKKP